MLACCCQDVNDCVWKVFLNCCDFISSWFAHHLLVFKIPQNAACSKGKAPGALAKSRTLPYGKLQQYFVGVCAVNFLEEIDKLRCYLGIDFDNADAIFGRIPHQFHVVHCVVVSDAREETR